MQRGFCLQLPSLIPVPDTEPLNLLEHPGQNEILGSTEEVLGGLLVGHWSPEGPSQASKFGIFNSNPPLSREGKGAGK